ncbi:MAG: septal ring lytic transglycosylase RlpA family protein [Spirulina sp. SIO3F2]|nr:septal ring lytic transglycosylase RlpA family protein [Spirulina sp. SIO3F2]
MSNLLWGSVSATAVTVLLGTSVPAIAADDLVQKPLDKAKQIETVETEVIEAETVDVDIVEVEVAQTEASPVEAETVETISEETAESVETEVESALDDASAPVAIAFNQTIIYPHQSGSSTAATLFVNQIPVVTFLGEQASAAVPSTASLTPEQIQNSQITDEADPLWRAAQAAERISQIAPEVATEIALHWDDEQSAYAIQLGEETLLTIDQQNILPKTTRNVDQDALSVANLLRRQVGNAPALSVPNTPRPRYRATVRPTASTPTWSGQRGQASWYGPGFHGRRTANGERFNQNAMTAAHRTLPFGTRVRVTNLNNGRSAIVRINDRGPFIHGRVIDLSRAGASAIGMLGSGVAPVQVEVIGR